MAREIGYFEDIKDVRQMLRLFEEGPFVICSTMGNNWRVEVRLIGHNTTVVPHISIDQFVKLYNGHKRHAAWACDLLNTLVRRRRIVYEPRHKTWVAAEWAGAFADRV